MISPICFVYRRLGMKSQKTDFRVSALRRSAEIRFFRPLYEYKDLNKRFSGRRSSAKSQNSFFRAFTPVRKGKSQVFEVLQVIFSSKNRFSAFRTSIIS